MEWAAEHRHSPLFQTRLVSLAEAAAFSYPARTDSALEAEAASPLPVFCCRPPGEMGDYPYAQTVPVIRLPDRSLVAVLVIRPRATPPQTTTRAAFQVEAVALYVLLFQILAPISPPRRDGLWTLGSSVPG